MACPTCGERCTCSSEGGASARATLLDPESFSDSEVQPELYPADEKWRQEVASRVDAFCARRGRKRVPRTPSLSLDFERASRATVAAHYAVPEPQVEAQVDPEPEPAIESVSESAAEASNLIEFPRPAQTTPACLEPVPYADELAEPIIEKPRILDAEEPSGLSFGGEGRPTITLEPAAEPEVETEGSPIGEYASLGRRIFAAALDGVVIAVAATTFAIISLHMTGALPRSRTALLFAMALPLLLWAMYQYLFLVHAAATPGMRIAALRLRTFDDLPARRSLRRWRALAMMLSGLALGLGFFWAAIDEYGLCWHDRISHTVLRRE